MEIKKFVLAVVTACRVVKSTLLAVDDVVESCCTRRKAAHMEAKFCAIGFVGAKMPNARGNRTNYRHLLSS